MSALDNMAREKFWEVVIDEDGTAVLAMRPPLPFLADGVRVVLIANTPFLEIYGAGALLRLSLEEMDEDLLTGLRDATQVHLMEFPFESETCTRDMLIEVPG